MVANAHHSIEQVEEARTIFDVGYLVGVVGIIAALIALPLSVSQYSVDSLAKIREDPKEIICMCWWVVVGTQQ